uniref:Glutathione S-transferase n=1 Tax=Panagrolaimus sp. JU765 TaxID=591449 RepID=A0AC34R6Z5_9BILA
MVYKLYYFDFRGLGETARLLFHAAGQEFEDVRFNPEQWPEYKAQSPTGKAPFLEVDGHTIVESFAIYRFLANRFGYAGKDEFEKALVDSTADFFRNATTDTRMYLIVTAGRAEGDKDALYKEKFLPALEKTFPYIEQVLKKSGSGFIAPSGLTWADLFIVESLTTMLNLAPQVAEKYPFVADYKKRVHEHPKIKDYVASRKPTSSLSEHL